MYSHKQTQMYTEAQCVGSNARKVLVAAPKVTVRGKMKNAIIEHILF